jgi:hypothetical protein
MFVAKRATSARFAYVRVALASLFLIAGTGAAQQAMPDDPVVTYPTSFFDRYQPNTALDMVRQVPGFQLDDGADKRGFGATSGNILINDRYPSAKQDSPSNILARIPAAQVERIEVIRSQVREIDLRGRPIVVNLVLAEDMKAAIRWETAVRKNFDRSSLAPIGSISLSNRWRGMEFNTGIDARKAAYGDPGTDVVLDSSGNVIERRVRDHDGSGYTANAYFNASAWFGETLFNLNSTAGVEIRNEITHLHKVPEAGATSDDIILGDRDNRKLEIGLDAERNLSPELIGKAILLFFRLDQSPLSSQRSFDSSGNQTLFRQATTEAETTESIARLEFDWTSWPNHVIQMNLEGAKNVLDSTLIQIVDDGTGPVVVPVPGANTRVEENRGDFLISDTWSFNNFELDYGLGAETSTISQTGDAEVQRSFFFIKPHAALTYAPSRQRQTRFRLAREVSQLDFKDFVSATVFEDDDLALGNPDLKPETTWIAELSEERRFGELSVAKLTLFHHWISDVEDLLPLSPDFEAPGNIGDGRRWGVELESTIPLDAIGLTGAKLDVKARWQDSMVVDPVTGLDRVLSSEGSHQGDILFRNENEWAFLVDYRQDFEEARVAWGWNLATRAERPLFKVNELDVFDEETNVDVFIETTRWFGVKIRLTGLNLLDILQSRDRTVYTGERGLSPVDFRELRDSTNGARILLSFSGTF